MKAFFLLIGRQQIQIVMVFLVLGVSAGTIDPVGWGG